MRVTLNWLREFIDLELTAAEIAERLTAAGLEVEAVEEVGRELDGVVVAEIVRVDPHPGADRLVVCQVRPGDGGAVPVVCGARNMKAGDRVPLATPGARLPDGRRIEAAEIRGVRSEGMLCSAAELGLGPDAEGIMILPADCEVGRPVAQAVGIADTVMEIGVTPNRGDCLSVLGIARELAALTGIPLKRRRDGLRHRGGAAAPAVAVRIVEPELCHRYVARVVVGVHVAPAPFWMQRRLLAVGVRPINNVVDITNYVMMERGQPLHAFDLDRLPQPEIVVRRAGSETTFLALDGAEYELLPDDLVISSGGEPVAVAGVIGGAESAVSEATKRVLLESAWFSPLAVRRTARRLGLATESAYRFERGVDVEGVDRAAERAAWLLAHCAGGTVLPEAVDAYPRPYQPAPIQLRVQRLGELLGVPVERAEAARILKALGANVTPGPKGTLTVLAPSYRADLTREIDLVEEVARVMGYERIPPTLPAGALVAGDEGELRRVSRALRELLAAQGWCEAIPLGFASPRMNELFPGLGPEGREPIEIRNPLSQEQSAMRLSLLSGLAECVGNNLRQAERSIALFSCGKAFWRLEGMCCEGQRLAGVLQGELPREGIGNRARSAEFEDVKGAVELVLARFGAPVRWVRWAAAPWVHPAHGAGLVVGEDLVGVAGGLHPAVLEELDVPEPCWMFELDLDKLLQYPPRRRFRELPRFPAVVRDLALVTDEDFAADTVIQFVHQWGNEWIEDVRLFDQYRGGNLPPGKKSLAYSLTYRAADRTLKDEEVNALHERLARAVVRELGVELRG